MKFDRELARLLLEICRYTYAAGFNDKLNSGDKQDALNWIKNAGGLLTDEPTMLYGLPERDGNITSVACVATYSDRNIVAYMGTKTQFNTLQNALASIEDWKENFEALLVPFKLTSEQLGADLPNKDNLGGRVHRGFMEQLAKIQDQVVETLVDNGGCDRPVIVTGHSQGGAEAALATRALLAGGFTIKSTYTFAAPRPGNKEFIKSVPGAIPIHRIEFGDDIVAHVPPTLIGKEEQKIIGVLKPLSIFSREVGELLDFLQRASGGNGFAGLGKLCYGSNKTQALRVDLSDEQEAALIYDRVWSLARHLDHWTEHHHLAGTSEDVKNGKKGNYTALVSDFQIVS